MKIRVVEIEGIEEGYLAADDILSLYGTVIVRKGAEIEGKHMRLFKHSAMHQVRVIVPDEKFQKKDDEARASDYLIHKECLDAATIMIVDDSKYVRFKLEKIFFELGLRVVASAVNGKEAVEKAIEFKPTVITMDIEMPFHDGLSAILPIKEALPDTIIVMISSVDEEEKVLEALSKGAADFINKPIEPEKVKKTIVGNIVAGHLLK